ncbi:hypothetical protein FIV00_28300 [Labrenzia sp. THAF82]|nr:hypothetical protein FIV00_28300 [Labrenzia sp. THAF82]
MHSNMARRQSIKVARVGLPLTTIAMRAIRMWRMLVRSKNLKGVTVWNPTRIERLCRPVGHV